MINQDDVLANLQKKLALTIAKVPELKGMKIFLFGSQATNTAKPKSDIDIGVFSESPVPAKAIFRLEEELEKLSLLQTFDIVDFSKVPKTFAEHALKHSVLLSL